MSVSLSAERDRIQRQVEELEQSLSVTNTELELLSSETGDESDGNGTEEEAGQSAAGLLAQREKIQEEIYNLENVLGPHSPICVSDDDDSSSSSSSSDESELGLALSVDSCLQMNLVYQQVVQETLDQLETLLSQNHRQQKEVVSQLSGPIKETSREQRPPSSYQQSVSMFLGRFLKPYFKDKLTGLGPPANQETKEKASRMTGCLDNKKLKVKRWESWQKTLLIHSVSRDGLRRLTQPKLSKVDYLSQKLSAAQETDRQQLREQIDSLERDIDLLRGKKEEELIGDRYEEHDWQKISNIDFEGTRDAEDIRSFWQNFLHPSINKTQWSQEEVQQLREVSRRHGERYWENIAAELGTGRTAFMCLQTFQRFVSDSLRRGSWTLAEDALLRELVDKMRIGNFIPYTQMSYFMEGRDPAQLIYRWNQVLDPSLKKGPWTQEEDQLLMQAVARHGEKDWWKIRLEVPGRHDGACRDRYYDCLKVETKRGPFDKQEKELLLRLVQKHGVGRWAKIAAEIPHRYDAQCLREWRKLSRAAHPPAQRRRKTKKPPAPEEKKKMKKKATPGQKRIRRRLMKLKKEEEEITEEEEEEEMVVEYMDSDEETKKKKKEVVEVPRTKEVEKEEEEEAYIFPPIQEWTPAEKAESFTFLSFRPVDLPSSGDAHTGVPVRSTILGQYGRSVIIGPPPRALQWEERHSSSTLMMLTPDQLWTHMCRQADKYNNLNPSRGKVQTGKQNPLSRMTDRRLVYELQAAVTPWIGNLLIPAKTRLTAADALREHSEKKRLSSTPIFLLLLQTMNVDSVGCKEMIEGRRSRVLVPRPPPQPPPVWAKGPKTIARLLQERRAKEEVKSFDLQHKLILKQLQVLQQQEKPRLRPPQQLVLLQQPPPPPQSCHNMRGILLQVPPNMHPQMSPMSFPQTVTPPCTASIQLMPPSSLTTPPPAPRGPPLAAVVTSPSPAPPAPHRLDVHSVSVVPMNATSTCSPGPMSQNLTATQPVPVGSALPSQPCPVPSPSSSTLNPLRRRRQRVTEDQQAGCNSQNRVDVGGAGSGLDGAGDDVSKDGRRIRKLTLKAKALQEAAEARAKVKNKAPSSPRKKAQTQSTNSPPQTVAPPQHVCAPPIQLVTLTPQQTTPPAAPQRPPPAAVVSSACNKTEAPSLPSQEAAPPPLRLDLLLLPENLSTLPQNPTSTCSDKTVSSTENLRLSPPPSVLTSQRMTSSTSSPPAQFHSDHDYTFSNVGPTPRQNGPARCKSDSIPNKPSKAPTRGRKRVRVEKQPSVTSSQVGVVGGAGTGVTLEGKRVRKPSQRVRALQEATRPKAEAKRKRTSSSSPRKKRSRTSGRKQEVVVQPRPAAPLPGLCLHAGQSMWVMTPGGLVLLAEAPPHGLQLALVPSVPFPAPDPQQAPPPLQLAAGSPQPVVVNQPRPLPAPPTCPSQSLPPAFILQPVPNPGSSPLASSPPQPPTKIFLPYKGVIGADPAAPPPLRKEALQFDPSLMFLEPRAAVCDWLSGRGGVVVPGAGVALPYMPPFVSSLCTLSALLRASKSLTKSSLQLLCRGAEPRPSQTRSKPDRSTKGASSPPPEPPDLPDSTSDLRPAAEKTTAPSVSSELLQEGAEEAELVVAVRQLVAERFSGNPAYQLLKARFLSCFTVPALLATMQPITEKTVVHQANEEEEEEEEEEVVELKKFKDRVKQRRAERSSLLRDGSGAPANHFLGIISTNPPTVDQTGTNPTVSVQ